MSFINECCAIIRRSDKDMFYIYLETDGLCYNYYDANGYIVHKNKIISDIDLDFTKYSFSLDKNNNIYCIYCNNSLQVLQCNEGSSMFTQKEYITYDYNKFGLIFPYVKYIDKNSHIFYYVFNNNSSNTCALFHNYKHNDYWIENKIDFINYIVLNNFIILWNKSVPTVFYLNLINGCEEVFCARFNIESLTWREPLQITNTGKNKIYLSGIKDSINFYHLCFCEYEGSGYIVKYVSVYLNENKFNLHTSSCLSPPCACMYPSIIKVRNTILVSWVNFNKLFTCSSKNFGKSWSKPIVDDYSTQDKFIRASFDSNYEEDLKYNVSHVFSTINDVGILGI